MSSFQERLRILKEESGETQQKIASDLGITPQALSYYINGREPNYDVLIRIASYFDISLDYLLGVSKYKNKSEQESTEQAAGEFEKLFSGYDSNLFSILTNYIIKILKIENSAAKRAMIWNIVLTVGFHVRILDLFNNYEDVSRTIGLALASGDVLNIDLGNVFFPKDKNPREVYFLIQNSFNSQALNEDGYIYQETQKMIELLFKEICKNNDLAKEFGDKYSIKGSQIRHFVPLDHISVEVSQKKEPAEADSPKAE